MKLIFENWRKYTDSILNEDLLVESYEEAKSSVAKRFSKLFKGWVFENQKEKYDSIEKQIQERENDGKNIYGWEIFGFVFVNLLENTIIPEDITDKQAQIALLWNYRQFINFKILDSYNGLFSYMLESKGFIVPLLKGIIEEQLFYNNFHNALRNKEPLVYFYLISDQYSTNTEGYDRSKLIENFFHWNNFILDGKKDLNSVASYKELYELVKEARPLYMAWQEKQNNKDAEQGKELLLDDDNWQVIAIHNKGAACQLGKGSDWCTAAPGLEYFKQYYKPNDPLFFILDKKNNEKFQFHFGTQQFMDFDDHSLSEDVYGWKQFYIPRLEMQEEIMKVLAKVMPEKYDIAYQYLKDYAAYFKLQKK
jgi:hypothetical protein